MSGANDISNRIPGADLVKRYFFRIDTMHGALGHSKTGKNILRSIASAVWQFSGVEAGAECAERSMFFAIIFHRQRNVEARSVKNMIMVRHNAEIDRLWHAGGTDSR